MLNCVAPVLSVVRHVCVGLIESDVKATDDLSKLFDIDTGARVLLSLDSTLLQVGLIRLGLSMIGAKAPEALLKAADSDLAEIHVAHFQHWEIKDERMTI